MPDRVGLYLQDDYTLRESLDYVKYAEARGFDIVWQAESRLSRDSIIPIAAYAALTNQIRFGTAVMNVWTRNAATIASEFVTLDDLARDRIVCGLGAWHDPLAWQVGITRGKYLLALREVLTTVRRLIAMETVTQSGEFVQFRDVTLDVQHRAEPRRIPLFIGATGPKTLALSGEIADGVLLNYMVSPRYNEIALDHLETGADKANRTLYDIDRPQLIVCSVHDDEQIALDRARHMVAAYLVQQPKLMRANGVRQDLIDDMAQILPPNPSPQELGEAMRLIPDDVVRLVTAAGTPADARAKVREYVQAGASYPVLYPLGDVRATIDAFANGYSQA